jgi:hypothetical protein
MPACPGMTENGQRRVHNLALSEGDYLRAARLGYGRFCGNDGELGYWWFPNSLQHFSAIRANSHRAG